MGKYDDIINLPHHISDYHKPMSMINRAAQFAPFAALNGHDDAIEEAARTTESFKEISEEEKIYLSRKLKFAIENNSLVNIKFFVEDQNKSGGSYKKVMGNIKKWDELDNVLLMSDGLTIPIPYIYEIRIIKNNLRIPSPEAT